MRLNEKVMLAHFMEICVKVERVKLHQSINVFCRMGRSVTVPAMAQIDFIMAGNSFFGIESAVASRCFPHTTLFCIFLKETSQGAPRGGDESGFG